MNMTTRLRVVSAEGQSGFMSQEEGRWVYAWLCAILDES